MSVTATTGTTATTAALTTLLSTKVVTSPLGTVALARVCTVAESYRMSADVEHVYSFRCAHRSRWR
jgi:hypothetical protein